MARWRLRDPGSFPTYFHEAMQAGIGDKLVISRLSEITIRREAEDFRLFRFCLRGFPAHPTSAWERSLMHRTRVWQNPHKRLWELRLTSRPHVSAEITFMR